MARKSAPFSLRLSEPLDALVSAEARRSRRSKGAILAALAEEALHCRLFPGIAFRGADWERRAWIIGTSLDVWELVRARQDFGSDQRMLAETDITPAQLALALAYYRRFPDEIDAAVAESRRDLDALRDEFPTIEELAVHV